MTTTHARAFLALLMVSSCLVSALPATLSHKSYATMFKENGTFSIVKGKIDRSGVAWAEYSDARFHPSNFGDFRVKSNDAFQDVDQMYAAGYLEGALTAARLNQNVQSMSHWVAQALGGEVPEKVKQFFVTQNNWTRQQIKAHPTDHYWQAVAALLAQFDGLVAGYNENCAEGSKLDVWAFQMINGMGDLLDLMPALSAAARPNWDRFTPAEMTAKIASLGHCTGLIKVTGDLSDLFAAHVSWFTYSSMLRIYKHYDFPLKNPLHKARKVSFSSYPGMLESLDDFYIMDTGLIMVQTTNSVFNMTLLQTIVPQSLFAWQRVRLANSMASTGKHWAEVVERHNSGTYNNQYMIVNTNLFTPGKALPDDLLWVVEQIPGLVMSADVTSVLELGYWPSYNVPYFREIYERSGYTEMMHRYKATGAVSGLDYQMAPRAEIFRRDADEVTDMDSLMQLMRSNNYKSDPYSKGNPFNAICSRGDLNTAHPSLGGCYDGKVTNYSMARKLQSFAINGPTSEGLAPFKWLPEYNQTAHVGQPEVFDFEWELMSASWE